MPLQVGARLRRLVEDGAGRRARRPRDGLQREAARERVTLSLDHPLADEVARLQQENTRLQARLATAEAVIEIQKKVAFLLGLVEPSQPSDERS